MRSRLLLLAGALAAFGASLGSGFHFDDYAIFSDASLRSVWGWLEIWSLRQTRPLTYLSFWLNYQVGGQDPLGYHLLNVALHLGAVVLAYECLRRLLPDRAALAAAAIFALHPLQAEAVNYVWGRSIVLASIFCFGALLCWLEERRWWAVALFACALLAKEECVAFPLVLLFLPAVSARGGPRRLAPVGTMLLLSLAAGLRTLYATAVVPGAPAGFQAGVTPWNYLLAQGPAILRYLRLLFVPYGFTVDPDVRVPPVWLGMVAWAALLAVAAGLWRFRTTRLGWPLWALAGFVLLLPSSSVFPALDLAADRRMYLPLFAFSAAAGLLLSRWKAPAAPVAIAAVLAAISLSRTLVWFSDEALWREAVNRAPEKVRPKIQLSRAVHAAEALELLAQAARLAPYDPAVAAETGKVFLQERQPDAALNEFGRALALDPRDARNYNNRGVALEAMGQTDAARQDFERALAIDPGLSEARENLEKLTAVR